MVIVNLAKMARVPMQIYMRNIISTQIPAGFFAETVKLILKSLQCKGPQIATQNFAKGTQVGRITFPGVETYSQPTLMRQ